MTHRREDGTGGVFGNWEGQGSTSCYDSSMLTILVLLTYVLISYSPPVHNG